MAKQPLREMMRKARLSQHTREEIRQSKTLRKRTPAILKQSLTSGLNVAPVAPKNSLPGDAVRATRAGSAGMREGAPSDHIKHEVAIRPDLR
jgi:hypothetical protein